MKLPIVLALFGTAILASCSKNEVVNVDDALPAIEEPEALAPPPRIPAPAPEPEFIPTSASPFRTPAVTSSLVDEKDLLPGTGKPVNPASSGNDDPGTVIARPPASGGNE